MRIIFFSLISILLSQTSLGEVSLPAAIMANQQALVQQGTCEGRWQELADVLGVQRHSLDEHSEVLFVPCANWSGFNVAWVIYAKIDEPSRADGAIVKPQLFVNYKPNQRVMADNVVYNVQWDDDEQAILAEYHRKTTGDCGTRAAYKWNSSQQAFVSIALAVRNECAPDGEGWEFLIH